MSLLNINTYLFAFLAKIDQNCQEMNPNDWTVNDSCCVTRGEALTFPMTAIVVHIALETSQGRQGLAVACQFVVGRNIR